MKSLLIWLAISAAIIVFCLIAQKTPVTGVIHKYMSLAEQEFEVGGRPTRSKISIEGIGRIGDNMYQTAAVIGLAALTGRQPVLPLSLIGLREVFDLRPAFYNEFEYKQSSWLSYVERSPRNAADVYATIAEIGAIDRKRDIVLRGYFNSYLYFDDVKAAIRREFTITEQLRQEALSFFDRSLFFGKNVTTVGIHLRYGDAESAFRIRQGQAIPPIGYFNRAMRYFMSRHRNIQFVVTSDNKTLALAQTAGFDYVLVRHGAPPIDLAILALCDHVITSRGTFSWWVGWLSKGTVIYYKQSRPNGTGSWRDQSIDIPKDKHWIGMRE